MRDVGHTGIPFFLRKLRTDLKKDPEPITPEEVLAFHQNDQCRPARYLAWSLQFLGYRVTEEEVQKAIDPCPDCRGAKFSRKHPKRKRNGTIRMREHKQLDLFYLPFGNGRLTLGHRVLGEIDSDELVKPTSAASRELKDPYEMIANGFYE